MKNLLRASALLLLITLIAPTSKAQNYKFALDGRMGAKTYGVSARYFANNVSAIDGIFTVSHDHNRFLFTGLYEEHYQLGNMDGLSWFAGAGMHIGYNRITTTSTDAKSGSKIYQALALAPTETTSIKKEMVAGVDVIIGIDYKFKGIPVNIGFDVKPYVDFINSYSSIFDGGVRLGFAF